jgi:hypothetical protein
VRNSVSATLGNYVSGKRLNLGNSLSADILPGLVVDSSLGHVGAGPTPDSRPPDNKAVAGRPQLPSPTAEANSCTSTTTPSPGT